MPMHECYYCGEFCNCREDYCLGCNECYYAHEDEEDFDFNEDVYGDDDYFEGFDVDDPFSDDTDDVEE